MFCICHRDNYGFVTYYDTKDAFTAIENGSKLRKPDELPFDLCFGGRRQFCQSSYADLGMCQSQRSCSFCSSYPESCLSVKMLSTWFSEHGRYWLQFIVIQCPQQKKNTSTKTKCPKTWHITPQVFEWMACCPF